MDLPLSSQINDFISETYTEESFNREYPDLITNIKEANIARDVASINENTVIFEGNLNVLEYESLNTGKPLPKSLRYVKGNFNADDSLLEEIDLEYIGGEISCDRMPNLKTFNLGNARKEITIVSCPKLESVVIGNLFIGARIRDCPKLLKVKIREASDFPDIDGCEIIEELIIGEILTTEGFENETLKFSNNLVSSIKVGDCAHGGKAVSFNCRGLKSLEIGDVKSLIFVNCQSLELEKLKLNRANLNYFIIRQQCPIKDASDEDIRNHLVKTQSTPGTIERQ